MSDDNGAAEIKTPLFSAAIKGKDIQIRDIIGLIVLLVTSITAYAVWEHGLNAPKEMSQIKTEFSVALKEMVQVNKDIAQNQSELNCLISLPTDKRESQVEICKRIAR